MESLQQARMEINAVDEQMAVLFVRRMEAVRQVIAYKMEHGLPIFDEAREQAVLENGCQRIAEDTLKEYYREFLVKEMELSKRYQQAILDQLAD